MRRGALVVVIALLLSSCTGVRSVQLRPPTAPPPGLIWGYGVEKIRDNPHTGRQGAYLKAIDDLLTRGPVLVSKTVQDNTTVIDIKSVSRTMESTFRLRASRMLQPSFMNTGVEDGFVWVLVGTTEDDIERGFKQFLEWRAEKVEQARKLFVDAKGPEKISLLKASFSLLEEAGAQDDPSLLYYQVKAALDTEASRIAEIDNAQKRVRALIDSGRLVEAETTLDQALRAGFDNAAYDRLRSEILDHRKQAAQLIASGDDLFRHEEYGEALERYQRAQRLDRDNPQLPTKLAMAEEYHRTARRQTMRSTAGVIGWEAARTLGEFFAYKREEERRKRAEAEKTAQREKKEAEKAERQKAEREKAESAKTATPEPGVQPPAPPSPEQPEPVEEKKEIKEKPDRDVPIRKKGS